MICCANEVWTFIKGFEPFYRISTCGRVQTCRARGGRRTPDRVGKWRDLRQFATKLHRNHRCLQVYLYKNSIRVICTVHRLVYESFKGDISKELVIDHIDNDSLNNHLGNLRPATQAQNQINSKNKSRGIYKYKGNVKNPYRSKISFNNKEYWLGRYATYEEAFEARKEAEIKFYGEFSNKLN